MNNIKYYLVLEKRLGDYNYIDINRLDICQNEVNSDLTYIDFFTLKYTEEEIKDAIARSNMVQKEYLEGKLKIVSDAKHNLKVLTKDVFEETMQVINGEIEIDQDLKNKLYSAYKGIMEKIYNNNYDEKLIETFLNKFRIALKTNNLSDIFKYIGLLPYNKGRSIYFMIYDELNNRKVLSIKKLEKLNDNE